MNADPAVWRLFVAIEIPTEVRSAIERTIQSLRSAVPDVVRWSAVDNIHLTLKFLGNYPSAEIDRVVEAIGPSVSGRLPVELGVGEIGVFPPRGSPRVIWLGLTGEIGRLVRLQQSVESALAGIGLAPENRPYQPHLTLGRIRDRIDPAAGRSLVDRLRRARPAARLSFTGDRVCLIRSELSRNGPTYYQVAAWSADFLARP